MFNLGVTQIYDFNKSELDLAALLFHVFKLVENNLINLEVWYTFLNFSQSKGLSRLQGEPNSIYIRSNPTRPKIIFNCQVPIDQWKRMDIEYFTYVKS